MANPADYIPDVNAISAKQKQERQQFNLGQQGQEQDYLKRYTGAIQGQEGMTALSERIGQELGLPQLRKNATMLQTTLENLPSTWNTATRGFDVNQNQLDRIIGQKASELTPTVNKVYNALNAGEAQLGQRLGYAQTEQAKQLMPYQTEQSLITDRFAREATGYNQDSQNELNAILQKAQMGIQLTQWETDRADRLAEQEKQYELQKQQISFQTQKQPGSNLMNVGGQLYDPTTGQWITPPKTTSEPTPLKLKPETKWKEIPMPAPAKQDNFQPNPMFNLPGLKYLNF